MKHYVLHFVQQPCATGKSIDLFFRCTATNIENAFLKLEKSESRKGLILFREVWKTS